MNARDDPLKLVYLNMRVLTKSYAIKLFQFSNISSFFFSTSAKVSTFLLF